MNTTYRWYVYELVDPRTAEVFYVGKGQGNRIAAHELEARRADGVCSEKISQIKDIWADGLQVERRHVAFFSCERAAYAFEADRIGEYGVDHLTNIARGGGGINRGGTYIRPRLVEAWPPSPARAAKILSETPLFLSILAFNLADGKVKLEVSVSGTFARELLSAASGWLVEKAIPLLWKVVCGDEDALKKVIAAMRSKCGVELVHGCA